MNPKLSSFLVAAFTISATVTAWAGPGPEYWQTLRQAEQFAQLKSGDKIAYACNECKTVTVVTVQTADQAMDHCKEGAVLVCPSCKTKVKVVMKGSPKNPSVQREVVYTNAKGEECLFVAKVVANQ
jgi:hypothetical protein